MDSKKTTFKTWYTRPTCDSMGAYIRPPPPSAPLSPGPPAPSASGGLPVLGGPHMPVPSTLPVALPYHAQMPARSSVLPLPGVASFLPRYGGPNGGMMVPSVRMSVGGPPRMSGSTTRACRPPNHPASLLSSALTSSHVRSAASSNVWHMPPSAPRHTTARSATSGARRYPASAPPMTGAVSGQADVLTSGTSQQGSPDFFRPVGLLLKNKRPTAPVAFTSESHVGGQAHGTNPAFLYCTPPASHRPWNSASTATKWTPNHSYSTWTGDDKLLLESRGPVCSYGQALPGNTMQPNYSVYPISRVYPPSPGSDRDMNQVSSVASGECSTTFHNKNPPASVYGDSPATSVPLYDARHDAKDAQYAGDVDSHGQPMNRWSRWESGDSGVKSIPDTSTTVGCSTTDVSVVTVRADDSTLFMASPAGTTSQTEREFSLHDAKMQLAEASSMSDPPAPPSSPYSSLCALSCGGAADRLQVQPTPGDEVKPHPGLDMLSDVSLLVESLTSQGSSGRSKDGQYAASSSSSNTAVSSLECGSYPSEEDVDATLCAPQATYMGTLPPDPDSTITLPTATRIHGAVLPEEEEDLEYTAMDAASVIRDVMCPTVEVMQQQYTLMLPPKKSTKFTKGSGTDSPSDQSLDSSHKPGLIHKLSRGHSKTPKQRGRPRKKMENQDEVTSETHDSGTKKRKSPKVKDTKGKYAPSASGDYWSTPPKQAKGQKKKKSHRKPTSSHQKCSSRGEESSCAKPVTKISVHQNTLGYEAHVTESNLLTPTDPAGWLMEPVPHSSTSLQQSDTGEEHPARVVCKSEGHEHSLPCTRQTSAAQTEAATVPNGEEPHATSSRDSQYEDMCPKVHFDPMVIAEEEVTSTQPHDHLLLTDDISTEDRGRGKRSKWRRRSQTFMSYTEPSSDEESSPLHSARTKPCKGASLAGTFSKGHSTTSSPQPCTRCQRVVKGKSSMMCDACEGGGFSSKEAVKGGGDKASLPCQVCGRTFSSSSNLSRHQRNFHPSIFLPGTHILEFPITSPQSRGSSVSFASSVKSADSSPSTFFPEKPLSCLLPSLPSSTIPYDKTPLTPHNSPCHSPPPAHMPAVCPAGGEESCGPGNLQQEDQTDQSDTGPICGKRRKLRKTSKQDDREWQPPKKLEPGHYGQRVTRQERQRARGKVLGKVTKQNTHTHTPLNADPSPRSSGDLKCPLNFRTKKRTRINSTIPCPHCDRTFSVMSNLKRHTKRQHGDVNVFVCNVCSYKINMRRKLNKHMKSHAGAFPHTCRGCLARFRSEAEMKSHGKNHAIFRFPCADCNLIFYTEEHLGDHMTQYHVTVVSD